MGQLPLKSALPKAQKLYAPRSLGCVFPVSSNKENRRAYILAQYANNLFEYCEFGNEFWFEGFEIQILYLGELK